MKETQEGCLSRSIIFAWRNEVLPRRSGHAHPCMAALVIVRILFQKHALDEEFDPDGDQDDAAEDPGLFSADAGDFAAQHGTGETDDEGGAADENAGGQQVQIFHKCKTDAHGQRVDAGGHGHGQQALVGQGEHTAFTIVAAVIVKTVE